MRAPPPTPISAGTTPRIALRALLVAALAAGCTLDPPPPDLAAVSPAWGYNGETTEIAVAGENFFPTVVVGEAADGGGRIEGTFQAWLEDTAGSHAVEEVRHLGYDRLAGEVPAGIEPGVYDLRVRVPSGLEATLPGAFTVTDTRADHLDLYVSDASYVVGSYAAVTITLQDPAERAVPQAMEVEVRATPASDASSVADVVFYADGLDGQVPLESGVGVRGRLEEGGTGVVLLTSESRTDVRLEVLPVDDAVVRGDEQVLSWEAGPVNRVELVLPRSPFRTVAGSSFDLTIRLLDAFDNLLEDEPAALLLWDDCGNEITPFVEIVGEGTVPVTLTAACELDTISAFAYETVWTTDTFEVLPGPIDGYAVTAAPPTIVAGEDALVFVEAVDAYGNLIPDHDADLHLRDDRGGLDPDLAVGEQLCPGFSAGAQVCTATPWTAAAEVVLRAEDEVGRWGAAAPIQVVPADAASVQVLLGPGPVAAGEEFEVVVRVNDRFGNAVSYDPGGSDPVVFSDDTGTIACRWVGATGGGQGFACAIEGATDDAAIEATVLGLSGAAPDVLEVTNGPLALVELEPQGTGFMAGAAFSLDLRAYDAYGNAYVVQADPVVELTDTAGTMTPDTATLDADGTATVSATVFASGTTRLYAGQAGTRLGSSRTFVVAPAALDGLSVEVEPWVSVDEPAAVVLTAVDAYGNAVDSYAGVVSLTPRGVGCEQTTVTDFEDGVAQVALACTTPSLSETLVATDEDGFGGESDVFDVVDLACADGPSAAIAFDGDTYGLACLAEGGSVAVSVETGGSTRGGSGLAVRHFSDGESAVRTLAGSTSFTYTSTGTRRVGALVVAADACADLAEGYVYVGSDDGEPTGPVELSLSAPSASSTGTVTVTAAATDCTGDVASGQDLYVRADLGTPAGTSSGGGLYVTLDTSGGASFAWAFDTGHSGTATIYAGSFGGGALGTATLTVTDDAALPEVVSVDPSGTQSGTIEAVSVVFTEPMLARNMTETQAPLTGPDGLVSATYALSADLTTLTITPAEPLDAAAGTYTLALTTSVRDVAGNQLDGGWSDAPAALSVPFGDVGSALPTVSSCAQDTDVFSPDGDDGPDADADTVGLTPVATSVPAWWWLLVTDAEGERVRSLRQAGTDPVVAWDGRGDDGRIAEEGTYALALRPIDTYGNVGGACDGAIDLEQHLVVP